MSSQQDDYANLLKECGKRNLKPNPKTFLESET